jgi:hypothetical protein
MRHNKGMENETPLQTAQIRLRRTHLGNRYDIYTGEAYRATAQTAAEINPILQKLNLQ